MTAYRDAENRSPARPDDGFSYPWDKPAETGKREADPRFSAQSNDSENDNGSADDTDDIPPFDRIPSENGRSSKSPLPTDNGFPNDGLPSNDGLDEVREAVDEAMRERYEGTVQSYQLWFERLRLKALTADRALFVCENNLKLKIIAERFRELISDALEEVLGYRPRLELDVDPSLAPDLAGGIRFGPVTGGSGSGKGKSGTSRQAQTGVGGGSSDGNADGFGEEGGESADSGDGWDRSDPGPDGDVGFSFIRGRNGREGRIDAAGRLSWEDPDTDAPSQAVQSVQTKQADAAGNGAGSYLPGDRPGFMPDADPVSPSSPSRPAPPLRFSDDPEPEQEPEKERNFSPQTKRPVFHDGYTFDNFIVGSSNQMAHAAALSVADNVGLSINPLFIWGPAGLGKTHLMYAIANRAVERDPTLRVICVKGEEFMNELIEAIQRQKNQAFRDKYRKTDMLLIDDIQFIAGKESTQTEFFHTFDALYEDRKQIIITSDRPPKDLTSLENRIRSRFEAGLLVDIQPPDYELRMAILRDKIHQSGMEIPTEVIDFLAKNLQENIRQLEGVVKKLSMAHMVSGNPITMELVLKTVPEYLRSSEPLADTVARIIGTTGAYYNVKPDDILGKDRKKNIQTARNVSMYLVRTVTGASYPQIGVFFYRDHSTVHSNIAKVEAEIADDAVFEANVDAILKEIRR
ncbi:MAG: chromosomal replication initiator protein DnaA [Ruminococcaceae bacterium]|jgi:chromosomal replication initiator protein|nr:chromosomal replication initiator protein DnaA [Oscillospiraceae bacterium]